MTPAELHQRITGTPSLQGWRRIAVRRTAFRRLAALTAGATAAQALVIAASPLLTRLYTPAQFGMYGVATAAIGLAGALATLRLEMAIPLPEDDGDAATLAVASLGIAAIVALVTGLAVYLIAPFVAPTTLGLSGVIGLCVGASVFALGVYNVGTSLATRDADVGTISIANATSSGGIAALQLALGAAGASLGLIIGDPLGRLVGVVGEFPVWRRWAGRLTSGRPALRPVIRYRSFPLVSSWGTVLNVLTLQAPTVAVVALYGAAAGGSFLLVQRVAAVPVAVLGVSVGRAFLVDVVERSGDHRIRGLGRLTNAVQGRLLMLGLPFAVVGAFAAPLLFPIVFGPDWLTAGLLFAIQVPYFLIKFATSPIDVVYVVLERQDLFVVREGFRFVMIMGAIILGAAVRPSLEWFVVLLTVAGVAGYTAYSLLARRAIAAAERQLP